MKIRRYGWMGMLILLVSLIVLTGCAPAAPRYGGEREVLTAKSNQGAAPAAAPKPVVATVVVERESTTEAVLDVAQTERMIILTGNLALVVTDTPAALERIKKIAADLGGFVVNSNVYDDGELVRGNINIRVPADKFNTALEQCKAVAQRVRNESTNGEDVTEEYTDLSARLRNLEATETELLELLATVRQRTGKAEDILAVYRELTTIRGQIEQLKGRMQYLERMTAMSTIQIELIPATSTRPIAEPGWRPADTLRESFRALIDALQFIVDLLIRLVVVVLPILIIIAIPIVALILLIRWLVRRGKRRS